MQIHLDTTTDNIINRYTASEIVVNNTPYPHTLLLGPTALFEFADTHAPTPALIDKALSLVLSNNTTAIIGMGDKTPPFDAALFRQFAERQVSLERMSLPAACRTFNVLSCDGRQVVAMLIL